MEAADDSSCFTPQSDVRLPIDDNEHRQPLATVAIADGTKPLKGICDGCIAPAPTMYDSGDSSTTAESSVCGRA
jgi:hypothetical protein